MLHTLNSKQATLQQLNSLFCNTRITPFCFLPGAGELLASLLVKFGEDRRRFPHSSMVQTLAGTAPVTNQSGKVHLVHFRRSCDKEFRYFSQQLARSSRQQSRWGFGLLYTSSSKGPLGQSLLSGFSQPLAGHSLENVARPNHL
ncbi:IS110 family transposase [Chloroflexi bacterium TSY]|nr:IS110 family transposase [Chloroflexi bacterium TSY]